MSALPKKIAFLGTGKLNQALLRGLSKAPHSWDFSASVRSPDSRAHLTALFPTLHTTLDNKELLRGARHVILGVKPQHALALVAELSKDFEEGATLVSLCARLPIARLREAAGPDRIHIVRLMPNTACEVRNGLLGISTEDTRPLNPELAELFALLGKTLLIDESQMDAFTILGACTPAFFLNMAQAIAKASTDEGLDPDLVRLSLAQVFAGAGALLADPRATLSERIAQIATPGGVTAEGLRRLEEGGLQNTAFKAFETALEKCRSLKL